MDPHLILILIDRNHKFFKRADLIDQLSDYLNKNPQEVDQLGDSGITLLMMACNYQLIDVIDLLLKLGANVNAVDILEKKMCVLDYLLTPGKYDQYYDLSDSSYCSIFQLLLNHGADVNQMDRSLIIHVVFRFDISTIKMCLDRIDIQQVNEDGNNILMLMLMIKKGNVLWDYQKINFLVGLLLDYGINIDARNKLQQTALMMICKRAKTDYDCDIIINILLARGANPNLQNIDGNTALHLINPKYCRTIQRLLDHQADFTIKNNDGVTFLDILRSQDYVDPKQFELLLAHQYRKEIEFYRETLATHPDFADIENLKADFFAKNQSLNPH